MMAAAVVICRFQNGGTSVRAARVSQCKEVAIGGLRPDLDDR